MPIAELRDIRIKESALMVADAKWKRSVFRGLVLRIQMSSLIPKSLRRRMLNAIGADIHATSAINHSCWLGSADIVMGEDSSINSYAFYDGEARLTIEPGVQIAVHAIFITASHAISSDPSRRSSAVGDFEKPITIGRGSWLGARCTVLPGVTIAPGCVIGAGAVVSKSTRPNGLYLNQTSQSGSPVHARLAKDL
jgi:maltose O-acetyltransferase